MGKERVDRLRGRVRATGCRWPRRSCPPPVKTRWIAALAAAGLPEIEVGSFVPPPPHPADGRHRGDRAPRRAAAARRRSSHSPPTCAAPRTPTPPAPHRISIPVSVSEGHSRANTNRGSMEQVAEVGRIVAWLRTQTRRVEVEGACSTSFGCSIDGVVPEARGGPGGRRDLSAAGRRWRGARRHRGLPPTPRRSAAWSAPCARPSAPSSTACTCMTPWDSAWPTRWRGWTRACATSTRLPRRPRRLPVRAGRLGQHRHRGPRVHAGEHGLRDRNRHREAGRRPRHPPGRACRTRRCTAPSPAPACPRRFASRPEKVRAAAHGRARPGAAARSTASRSSSSCTWSWVRPAAWCSPTWAPTWSRSSRRPAGDNTRRLERFGGGVLRHGQPQQAQPDGRPQDAGRHGPGEARC